MGDEKSKKPIDPNISPYLRRPIRKMKEAEQDKDASDLQWKPIPLPGSSAHRDTENERTTPS
jgi:hypothetical protein